MNEKEISHDVVMYYINKHYPLSIEDQNEHLMILEQNPLAIGGIKTYLEVLEDDINHKKGGV